MVLCSDPFAAVSLQANQYWRHPFRPVMGGRQAVEFVVLDAEPLGPASDRFALADVQVFLPASNLHPCLDAGNAEGWLRWCSMPCCEAASNCSSRECTPNKLSKAALQLAPALL